MAKHIHRYERAKIGKEYVVYRCNLPNCNHYLARHLVKGKISLCNRCGNPMLMGALQLSLAKPHCMNCIKPKGEQDKIKQMLEGIG